MSDFIFTSESVTEGHPDKICDQISDAVLDALLTEDPESRVACETVVNTGLCLLTGEITSKAKVDYIKLVRNVIKEIGYEGYKAGGFDFNLGFLIQKEYDPSVFFLPIDFIYLVLLGIIIGIFAELYSRYVLLMQNLGKKWYRNKFVLKMSICGLILGSIYSFLPSTFHNLDELQKIIAEQNTSIGIALLAVLVLFITPGLAAASGAPGGLFYPMLTLGGSIGLIMGSWVEIATGHAPSTYIFAGMGAFVAGCSRTPITAMFLAFALTKNLLIMKPVLISCIASFLIARAFNEESIYERQIQIELED